MRELKFRAWDNANNEWLNKGDAECLTIYLDGRYEIDRGWCVVVPDLTIEQYTGLKDKNGKEIYEGDIVKFTEKIDEDESTLYKVIWDEFLTGYDLINLERSKADTGYLNKYNIEEHFEVVGNIHENPELLGENNEQEVAIHKTIH